MEKLEIFAEELLLDIKKRGHRLVRLVPENGFDLDMNHPFVRMLAREGIIWYNKGHPIEDKKDYEINLSKYKLRYRN